MSLPDRTGLSRREYLRAVVAVGGASALSACVAENGESDVPSGTDDPESLPSRQHAWNDALSTDDDGNVQLPEHHVLLALSLVEDGAPTDADRETVETSLRTLERAYEWSNEGLVFTIGYTPAYFERVGSLATETVDLPAPTALTTREDPEPDDFDALLHLASDHAEVVLRAEEALFSDVADVNGVDVDADLSSIFERVDDQRRTGFVGPGLPADHTDTSGVPEEVPEDAPFFMGFRSGFRANQATEDRVTITEGPFEGGTTQHVSSMDIQLETWFTQDSHRQRVSKMFSPEHVDEDLVGEIGEQLSTSSGVTDERIEATAEDARTRGVVGHAQKAARAREDGHPLLLRRDFNTVDGDRPGLHFLSLQREIEEFVRVREAMTGSDLAGNGVGGVFNNGILQYIFVNRRGNYLVPPRSLRALPPGDPA
ncbi:DUF7405 family protein [Natronoglomus mannanivorans]|uniref:Tat pathway signal protein n=1 Tax=Natronoglomus mannanivorans TaxID=2979990 RepID=A0AAP2YYK7_9EURY|nr:Tat pathway signal protein [Halobacteria archaeon AArc-xg1-1]